MLVSDTVKSEAGDMLTVEVKQAEGDETRTWVFAVSEDTLYFYEVAPFTSGAPTSIVSWLIATD